MARNTGNILLVDDDPNLCRLLSLRLSAAGHTVKCAGTGQEALKTLSCFRADIVITDLRMDGMDGIQLLDEIGQRRPSLPVIIITAHGTIPEAVKATQSGAINFLTKPVDKKALLAQVHQALRNTSMDPDEDWASGIITRSNVMRELLADARLVANSESSVLIIGESGTGKELLARALHRASKRASKPFIAINCAAMPEHLLESELFGHERGAFTDATSSRPGLFRSASGGTIFLDEIGDMPVALQAKLLRVLQEHEVRPIGASQSLKVDVRVLSATHRDLEQEIEAGRFREDLYYRLNVVHLKLPPLAERPQDIPLLVNYFLRQLAEDWEQPPKVYAPNAMELLVQAEWPGNVRQLANCVEQNVALSPGRVIPTKVVQKALKQNFSQLPSLQQAREEFMRNYLIRLLQISEGNVSRAARLAKRNRSNFYKLLNQYQVNPGEFKGE